MRRRGWIVTAAALWFERGERARASELRAESRALTKRIVDALKKLGRGRPKREILRQEIEAALPVSPPQGPDRVAE